MGKGIDLAREDAPEHAAILDDFKDQLLIVLLKRCADKKGRVSIPISEIDNTESDFVEMAVNDKTFKFRVIKKS